MFTIVKGCSNSLQKGLIKNSGAIARLVLLSCDGGQLSNFVSCVAYKCCFSRHILKCQINKLLEMLLLQVKNWRLSSEAIKRSKEQLLARSITTTNKEATQTYLVDSSSLFLTLTEVVDDAISCTHTSVTGR